MKRTLPCVLLLLALSGARVAAQDNLRELEVWSIRFEGNEQLRDGALASILQTRPTPAAFWKFLHRISEKLGDKPEYFDPAVFEADYLRLSTYYLDQGFFNSRIDTQLAIHPDRKRIDITFRIHEGKRSFIDSVQYLGFDELPRPLLDEIGHNRLVTIGGPFIMEQVVSERARMVNAFFNHGYVDVRVDSVVAHRFLSTNNIKLIFAFTPGKRYLFGEIRVQQDTTVAERVEERVILRHLDFARGSYFSEARKVESERNLNRLGVFETSRIEPVLAARSDSLLEIPMRVFVRSRPFHELVPEIGMNDENNAFNVLVGIGYNHRNFLGGARNFSTRLKLQVQSIQDVEFNRVFKKTGLRDSSVTGYSELSAQLTQPYFFNNKTTLSPSLSVIVDKRSRLYFNPILRARVNVSAQLARYTTGSVEWNLERIGFEPIRETVGREILDALRIDQRPVFNSSITFTLQRDKRNDPIYPSEGFLHSGSFEEAGLLPAFVGGLSDLPYSQYIKLSGLGQWYWDLSGERHLVWAARVRGGFAVLYGHSPAPIPFIRRFFAGGSGSVRGWKARDLGALDLTSEGGNALIEANLEARWNLLREAGKLWFVDLNRISFVFFYDVGNVWREASKVRGSEIAMATGLGLRYDTAAGPFRIDLGIRVYDPAEDPDRRWITRKRFFAETLSRIVPHFGIGHAF